ncbi:MAG: GtrA family protein, partial [Hyphomicrobiales bacterium]|nr:GtrA family protein [Hyphomicrobiales bacterium]
IGDHPTKAGAVRLLAVWLVSFNVVWSFTAQSAAHRFHPDKASDAAPSEASCVTRDDYAALAALPHATVLAVSNLGAPILRYTPQRVLAGPYHRNVEGDLATLNAFIGTDAEARDIVRRYGVTIVASCPGNAETIALSRKAPDGLAAHLARGDVPAWLVPVPSTADQPLKLFRVVR